ncbi:MAG: IS21 family transposase [Thaumarchaeota archaeon]|nr:IS21 family transposase [Nitrososphaerota archaeon]
MEIRHLIENGVSKAEISRMLGIDRKTVKKYAHMDIYSPYLKEIKLQGKLEPYKDYIRNRLEQFPLNCVRIHEEISKLGYAGRMTILRDYVRNLRHEKTYHAVMEFETEPGQQGQVDWAYFGTLNEDGMDIPLYGFTMVLGYSRVRYVEFTNSMNLHELLRCHMNGFDYLGGVPHELLYDNMKQVVLVRRRSSDESDFQPLFSDFAAYYGIKPKLCRPRKPRTKGKVERAIRYIKDSFFLGLEFTSLHDLNEKARAWCSKVNSRVHGRIKEIPFERLKKERGMLTSIEGKPRYRISEVLYRKARCNCKVSVFSGEYSVPPQYANREVEVRIDEEQLSIFYRGQKIACHRLVKPGTVSFLDAHKQELEKHCFYMPRQNKTKRLPLQVDIVDQSVEKRDLAIYGEV